MLVGMLEGMGAVVLAKTNLPQSIMWLVFPASLGDRSCGVLCCGVLV